MTRLFGTEKTRMTSYNPKSDGLVERFNRTLVAMVGSLVDPNDRNWDDQLAYAGMAYRSTPQASTGESPNMMMFGEENPMPIDIATSGIINKTSDDIESDYVQTFRHNLKEAYEPARIVLKASAGSGKVHI
ncbi:uncharacterized protein LOC144343278 [Saccoglossus kowalevskii]